MHYHLRGQFAGQRFWLTGTISALPFSVSGYNLGVVSSICRGRFPALRSRFRVVLGV